MKKLNEAIAILEEAGEYIKTAMTKELDVALKTSVSDFVTNIDKGVEAHIVSKILDRYPDDGFITEEKVVENNVKEHVWVLDPIDGTTNLIYQRQDFAISLAYFENGVGVFGIVYDVMAKRMIWGHKDKGAFDNAIPLNNLNQTQSLDKALLYGDVFRPNFFEYSPEILKPQFIAHRFTGSAALEISNVACGKGQAYVFPKIKVWDVAAALIILKCVGGTWKMTSGRDAFEFSDASSYILACSNQIILEGIEAWL